MTRGKIVDRVGKLLRLAAEDSGGTEAERANALARAQELMHKHRIEERELDVSGRAQLPGVEQQLWHRRLGLSKVWLYDLAYAVGQGVGVDAIYVPRLASRNVYLVGRPEQIEYVKLVVAWIQPQLEREARLALAKYKERVKDTGRWPENPGDAAAISMAFSRSFYEHAVAVIASRLEAERRKQEQTSSGKDLVVSDRAALNEFYGDFAPEETSTPTYEGAGALAGVLAGEAADIDPSNKIEGGSDA